MTRGRMPCAVCCCLPVRGSARRSDWMSKTVIWMTGVRGCGSTARATGPSVWPFPPRRPRLSHDSLAGVGTVRCSVRIPARVCDSRPPWASYRPWHCGSACLESRRIHCGERSARSPVTLACRTGTSWPQAGGAVRRCSTITTCPVAGWMAGLAMDCRITWARRMTKPDSSDLRTLVKTLIIQGLTNEIE